MARRFYPFEREFRVVAPSNAPLPGFGRPPIPSSDAKISPAVVLVIVILAVILSVFGFLHLLVRFVAKSPYSFGFSRYGRDPDISSSDALQRQLRELFRLHDCGLDQDIVDALPVFCYKDIAGLKEPFDCAVCLCAFSDRDSLRLLPDCSHAFHVSCIDTWLLSNSTCPLCRGTLVSSGYSGSQFLSQDNDGVIGFSAHHKPTLMEEAAGDRRVYSVRLGKFRSIAHNEGVGGSSTRRDEAAGETFTSKLDARRCYSLGSSQYVIADSDLLVSLSEDLEADAGNKGMAEAKRISSSNKGESFSVSKIWQWSKKGKFTSSSDAVEGRE